MGSFSWVHWLLVAVVVLILFGGRGKISSLMGDFAQGIKAFKKGMAEEDKPADNKTEPVKTIDAGAAAPKTETPPPADPKTINHQATGAPAGAPQPQPEARKAG